MFERQNPLQPYKPAFKEAWQAEVLALANTLVEVGCFTAGEWAEQLGNTLLEAEEASQPDTEETYYLCILEALEALCAELTDISLTAQAERKEAWIEVYQTTPHGEPVRLKNEKAGS